MSAIKRQIIGALDLMNDREAEKVWNNIRASFVLRERSWADIEEVEPDEIDLEMLREIENDPDCKEFISSEEVYKELGL